MKKKKEENLDRYKHRCKEGEGRMKRREDKARIKGGVECNREYSWRKKKKKKKRGKRAKKDKHVSSQKVGVLENVKIAYKGMKEE